MSVKRVVLFHNISGEAFQKVSSVRQDQNLPQMYKTKGVENINGKCKFPNK